LGAPEPAAAHHRPKDAMTARVVRGDRIAWVRGLDTVEGMPDGYTGNLGPEAELADTYSRWEQKTLLDDPETTRRIDLVRLLPGFTDPGPAYHDSVEECLVLEGGCEIDGEGAVEAGDYFWRPPGWVHAARAPAGFLGLLMQEGISAGDASGPATRRVRPPEDLGRNALFNDPERSIGPRGWIRRLPTSLMPWIPATAIAPGEEWIRNLDHPSLSLKILSTNWTTGARSLLARFQPGYRDPAPHRLGRRLIAYVVSGTVTVDAASAAAGDLVDIQADSFPLTLSSPHGAEVFIKLGSR